MNQNKEMLQAVSLAYAETKRLVIAPAEDLHEVVQSNFEDLYRQAIKLRFWRERLPSETPDINSLGFTQAVQVLTRSTVQENLNNMRLKLPGTNSAEYYISKTSGSTGKPVEVMKFRPSQAIQQAVTTLVKIDWANLDVTLNLARLRNNDNDFEENISWGFPYTLRGKTGNSYTLSIAKLGAETVLRKLKELDVSYLHGTTTQLKALAFAANSLESEELPKLSLAMTWAESVTLDDREMIRNSLGVEIYDAYSSEEIGFIAMQCPKEVHLHSLPFFVNIEVVDDKGAVQPVGQVGRMVATPLHNYAQPMLRYELGDLASIEPPCEHFPNLPVISPEVTRQRDVFIAKDGNQLFPRFGKCRFMSYKGLSDFQVIVLADSVLFLYASKRELSAEQLSETREDVSKQFGGELDVHIERIDQTETSDLWKRKVFYRSNLTIDEYLASDRKVSRSEFK